MAFLLPAHVKIATLDCLLKSCPYSLQIHIEYSILFELRVHVVSVVFPQRTRELNRNHGFWRETVWFIGLKDHAQIIIGLFPDVL